ncbi:MAG: hypothetical protein IAE97_02610 [Chthoniobacterales bacterium]|nr:hypothetical protein [Chthoniobacterales bacterium]
MKRTHVAIAAIVAAATAMTVSRSEAQATITNWDTGYFNSADGYIQGASLTDTPTSAPPSEQFQTTDPYNGGTGTGDNSYVDFIPGTTYGGGAGSGSGNNSVWFGGVYAEGPGIVDQAIYKNFTSSILNATESATFSIDFRLIESTNIWDDSFSFDLRDASGTTTLVSFLISPIGGGLLDISGNGVDFAQIQYSGLYNLTATLEGSSWDVAVSTITVGTNGLGDVTSFVTNAPGAVSSGALAGGTAMDFESVYISWLLESGDINDWGDNYMIINQMNVTSEVIPEPGTWAMGALLLSGVAATIYRRRKAAVAATAVES